MYFTFTHQYFTSRRLIFIFGSMTATEDKKVHEGKNVKRIREILGIKQDDLATRIGLSQQAVSQLEAKESVDKEVLERIASAMGVNVDAIKNFNEEAAVNFFNTFNDNSGKGAFFSSTNNNCTFNPLEELMKALEENKKLYERLLQSEREKVDLLESLIKKS
jgi:transcriptional regulator with XRE-family HTH domain